MAKRRGGGELRRRLEYYQVRAIKSPFAVIRKKKFIARVKAGGGGPTPIDTTPISVKDAPFSAVGDGIADDTATIQAAFDFAFGPASAPHGKNFALNRPVYFPAGYYKITAPLVLTQVYKGIIFSGGAELRWGDDLTTHNPATILKVNGMEQSMIYNVGFRHSAFVSTQRICLDLDCLSGSNEVLLDDVTLFQVGCEGKADIAFRIGHSGHGAGNVNMVGVGGTDCPGGTMILVESGTGHRLWGGSGASNCDVGIKCTGGSIKQIIGTSFSTNSTWDVSLESGSTIMAGGRTEHSNSINVSGAGTSLHCAGLNHAAGGVNSLTINNGATVFCDNCHFFAAVGASGTLTYRGTFINPAGFGGTVIDQNT